MLNILPTDLFVNLSHCPTKCYQAVHIGRMGVVQLENFVHFNLYIKRFPPFNIVRFRENTERVFFKPT